MNGSERQILKIIAELREADNEAIAPKVGVSAEYVAEICQSLAKDGYLVGSKNGSHKLTPKALEAMSPVVTRGFIPVLKGGA